MRILVVDDDRAILKLIERVLRDEAYAVPSSNVIDAHVALSGRSWSGREPRLKSPPGEASASLARP